MVFNIRTHFCKYLTWLFSQRNFHWCMWFSSKYLSISHCVAFCWGPCASGVSQQQIPQPQPGSRSPAQWQRRGLWSCSEACELFPDQGSTPHPLWMAGDPNHSLHQEALNFKMSDSYSQLKAINLQSCIITVSKLDLVHTTLSFVTLVKCQNTASFTKTNPAHGVKHPFVAAYSD